MHPAQGGKNFFQNYDRDNNLVPGLPVDEPLIHAAMDASQNLMYGEPVYMQQQP